MKRRIDLDKLLVMKITTQRSAFSLVELSIVLVILGLLVGGVLSGQSLIRAAELRSVAADFSRYHAAIRSFQDKYFAIPGDMTNATAFWGFAAGTVGNDAACFNASQTGQGTCNGTGNGDLVGATASANNPQGETFHAWKQLANAGLIEGSYTGFPKTSGAYNPDLGVNVPRGRLSNSGYFLWTGANGYVDVNWYPSKAGTIIFFGSPTGGLTDGPALKPEEAWNLDTKLDDGKAGLGSVRTYKMGSTATPNCTDGTDPNTSNYRLSFTSVACNSYMFIN